MNRSFFNMSTEQFNRLLAVLIAVVTAFAAVVAYLQADASTRDDRANRDSKRYAIEAFGREVSGDARVNFDNNVAYQAVYELELLSNSAFNRGDEVGADRYLALADEARALSPMMLSPYYDEQLGVPDVARYESDSYIVQITALRERFKAADTVKGAWDSKAKKILMGSGDSEGGHALRIGDYDPATKTIASRQDGVLGTGEGLSFEQRTRLVDKDTFEWSGTDVQGGKEALPDLTITFSRK